MTLYSKRMSNPKFNIGSQNFNTDRNSVIVFDSNGLPGTATILVTTGVDTTYRLNSDQATVDLLHTGSNAVLTGNLTLANPLKANVDAPANGLLTLGTTSSTISLGSGSSLVGLNKTNPVAALDVVGSIAATGSITTTGATISGSLTATTATINGGFSAGSATLVNGLNAGNATFTGGVTAGTLISNTLLLANSASITAGLTAGTITSNNYRFPSGVLGMSAVNGVQNTPVDVAYQLMGKILIYSIPEFTINSDSSATSSIYIDFSTVSYPPGGSLYQLVPITVNGTTGLGYATLSSGKLMWKVNYQSSAATFPNNGSITIPSGKYIFNL